ncbi:MAG: hypothetical protein K0V04_23190 [Deltaproteobacteria bacterium]|nr:hypothetical protein [Deltaproteobacteria bacterium]
MLRVRESQIHALAGDLVEHRRGTLVTRVAEALGASGVEPDECTTRARSVVEAAFGFGLVEPRDVLAFAKLTTTHGWAWSEHERTRWMDTRLRDPAIADPTERLVLLLDEVEHRDRAEQNRAEARGRFVEVRRGG